MTFGVMFHNFHGFNHPVSQGSISKNQTFKIIKFLKKKYYLNSANQFLEKLENKNIKKKDICLTFDDGLKCQIDIALPILKKEKIQAFFFIQSSIFSKNYDLLETYRDFRNTKYKNIDFFYDDFFLILKTKYKKIHKVFFNKFNIDYLKKYKFYTINDRKFRFCRDKILSEKTYKTIMINMMKKKNYDYVNKKKRLLMSKKDILKLLKSNHIIGLHSHSHPVNILKFSYRKQFLDYKKNKEFFKKNFGILSNSMSHPFGRYNKNTLKALKNIGIKVGFLSHPNREKIKSNLEIPRFDHINILKKV